MTMMLEDRAAQLSNITLSSGGHKSFDDGVCAMELAGWLAGEPWSDHPECVCPVIAAFMRSWNDALPDELRTETLLPLIPKMIGTKASHATQVRRAYVLADGAVRVFAPAALRAAGIDGSAQELEKLPEIVDATTASHAREVCGTAAYAAAYAAADAAAADAAARIDAWRELNPKLVALVERALAIVDQPAEV